MPTNIWVICCTEAGKNDDSCVTAGPESSRWAASGPQGCTKGIYQISRIVIMVMWLKVFLSPVTNLSWELHRFPLKDHLDPTGEHSFPIKHVTEGLSSVIEGVHQCIEHQWWKEQSKEPVVIKNFLRRLCAKETDTISFYLPIFIIKVCFKN